MSIKRNIAESAHDLIRSIAGKLQIKYLPIIFNRKIIFITTERWRAYRLNYEPYIAKIIKNNLSQNNIFFDVGAYYGYWTLFSSQIVGKSGRVVAFEPSPSFNILQKNIKFKNNCKAYNNCVSNRNSKMIFFAQGESSSSSLVEGITKINEEKRPGIEINSIETETITLDSFCKDNKILPNLIKIDVEGHEFKVLEGTIDLLRTHDPKLLIEIHPPQLKHEGNDENEIFKLLTDYSYYYDIIDKNPNSIYTLFAYKLE